MIINVSKYLLVRINVMLSQRNKELTDKTGRHLLTAMLNIKINGGKLEHLPPNDLWHLERILTCKKHAHVGLAYYVTHWVMPNLSNITGGGGLWPQYRRMNFLTAPHLLRLHVFLYMHVTPKNHSKIWFCVYLQCKLCFQVKFINVELFFNLPELILCCLWLQKGTNKFHLKTIKTKGKNTEIHKQFAKQ